MGQGCDKDAKVLAEQHDSMHVRCHVGHPSGTPGHT